MVGLPNTDFDAEGFQRKPLLLVGQLAQTCRDAPGPLLEIGEPALPPLPAGAAGEDCSTLGLKGALLAAEGLDLGD